MTSANILRLLRRALLLSAVLAVTGCAAPKPPTDYSAFKSSRPRSIVVLPPVNKSVEPQAAHSFLTYVSYPLAEGGYYVFPVSIVDEFFRENGLTVADDIHAVPLSKLREVFGADAALFITITDYGTRFAVIASNTVVTAKASLLDLKSGATLWSGTASASSNENNQGSQGGLAALLVKAIIEQIASNVTEQGHRIAGITASRLLTPGARDGLLIGPRSPDYMKKDP